MQSFTIHYMFKVFKQFGQVEGGHAIIQEYFYFIFLDELE